MSRRALGVGGCIATLILSTGVMRAAEVVWVRSDGGPLQEAREDRLRADLRYAPPWWQTSICLPDDWQKTLVSKEGDLLYDWPGSHSGFGTRVGVSLVGEQDTERRQSLRSPRIPIVSTEIRRGDRTLASWKALAVVPGDGSGLPVRAPEPRSSLVLERGARPRALPGWARPEVPCVDAFRNIVAGFDGPIAYRISAPEGARYSVAFGLLESYWSEEGKRIVELRVEGRTLRTVDLIADIGRHRPGVHVFDVRDEDGDDWIDLEVRASPRSEDGNAILNALWVFPAGSAPEPSAIATGEHEVQPLVMLDCGSGGSRPPRAPAGPPRGDLLLARRDPGGGALRITIDSTLPLRADEAAQIVWRDGSRFLTASRRWILAATSGSHAELIFPVDVQEVAVYCASGHDAGPVSLDWASRQPARAEAWWSSRPLPWGKIRVPDPTIQALLDSSVRNIFQAREVRDGLPIFQVGPTCYRGLWIVDGAFILEAMTYLDQVPEVRAGIRHLLGRAKPDGSFELIRRYWKENGIVCYILERHARLTQDREWLADHFPVLRKLVRVIRGLRKESRVDPSAPEAGLVPPGFPDGGVGGTHAEYTNVYWTLVGLRSAVEAARLLGPGTPEIREWSAEYEDMLGTFRRAAERDAKRHEDGYTYLPILMRPVEGVHPVRGQWAFCHAVHPGQVFEPDDPLVRGNLALLDSRECEGLVLGTGWMADGIWNYFASFYGHAHLWSGHGGRAAEILYAFANHASPTLLWREEQHPQGRGEGLVGDMPHNWASAEFIRLARNLIILERGEELHLLEGLPSTWVRAGAETVLEGIRTDFGKVSLSLRIDSSGRHGELRVEPPRARPPRRIVIHQGPWAGPGGTTRMGRDGPIVWRFATRLGASGEEDPGLDPGK